MALAGWLGPTGEWDSRTDTDQHLLASFLKGVKGTGTEWEKLARPVPSLEGEL